MAKLVSKTYGDALFELAEETNALDTIYEEAQGILEAIKENPEFLKLLTHPKISPEEKDTILEQVFKSRVSESMMGFLTTVGSKNRYTELESILEFFINRVKEYKKIGIVSVTSAVMMTDGQKAELEEKLLSTTKYESLEVDYRQDAELLGGMVIRMGDRVVDSSIRSKLSGMAKELYKIQLSSN